MGKQLDHGHRWPVPAKKSPLLTKHGPSVPSATVAAQRLSLHSGKFGNDMTSLSVSAGTNSTDELLDGLNPQQRLAVLHEGAPLLISPARVPARPRS